MPDGTGPDGTMWSVLACREDLEAVACGGEAQLGADAVADGDEFGDVDGDDLVGVDAGDGVVGACAVDELESWDVVAPEDALDDAGVLHELDGAVDGGFGDAVAGASEVFDEGLGLEGAVHADDGIEDAGPFGGVFLALGLEATPEDGAEGLENRGDFLAFFELGDRVEVHRRIIRRPARMSR